MAASPVLEFSTVRPEAEDRGTAPLVTIDFPTPVPLAVQAVALPHSLDIEVALGTLSTPGLRVVEPIRVRFFREDEHVVAEAPELEEFGYGQDLAEARRDLQRVIAELFEELTANRDRLGSGLADLLRTLERKLGR